jgi:hypothetical protein
MYKEAVSLPVDSWEDEVTGIIEEIDDTPRSGYNKEPNQFLLPAGIVTAVLSLVVALILFFGLVIRKKDPESGFAKWWKEFLNFRKIWIAGIMKFVYIFGSLLCIFGGIALMIYGFWEGREPGVMILVGLGVMIVGPILLRLTFEMTMLFVSVWENTADIRGAVVGARQRVEEKRAAVLAKAEVKPEPKPEA